MQQGSPSLWLQVIHEIGSGGADPLTEAAFHAHHYAGQAGRHNLMLPGLIVEVISASLRLDPH